MNMPFMLGLDIMPCYHRYIRNVSSHLVCVNEAVSVHLVRKRDQIYLDWVSEILYTLLEIQRIHKQLHHAKSERLYALMCRSKEKEATSGPLRQLEKIAEACDVLQRVAKEPSRFRVSMPKEDLCFNGRVMIDCMTLE